MEENQTTKPSAITNAMNGITKLFNSEPVTSGEHFWGTLATGVIVAGVCSVYARKRQAAGQSAVLGIFL